MSERDDDRFIEDASVTFAMYCDTNCLSRAEGERLAEQLNDYLAITAGDRPDGTEWS